MRNIEEELNRIIKFAEENENIRALVLQGSFVNDKVELDDFSDLDPLFYVRDVNEFIQTNSWKSYFGNPISEFSDEGEMYDNHKWYTRLTIFDDGFKIDFGFESVEMAKYANQMSLYKIYLDKDNVLPKPEVDDDRKFYIQKPSESEFLERINTFFFDTSYVAKSLSRNEMVFVKFMEAELQKKIRLFLEWYIGVNYDFQVNSGIEGRYMKKYLNDEIWSMLLKTYYGGDRIDCAKALLASYDLVRFLGKHISQKLNYSYPEKHNQDMLNYCEKIIKKYIIIE